MGKVNTRKRNDKWEYYFEIASVGGKRKRCSHGGYRTKKEALDEGNKVLTHYNRAGSVMTESDISFSDFLDKYLESYCESELSPITVQGYRKRINNYIRPALGKYMLRSIKSEQIIDLLRDMKSKGFSRNSVLAVKTILSSSFTYAVNELHWLNSSPMFGIKLPKESDQQKKKSKSGGERKDGKVNGAIRGKNSHIYIEKSVMDKILDRFPKEHPSHIPLITGYELGTRLGETFALTFDDFDFDKNEVTIRKQIQWDDNKKCWFLKSPKYDSCRTIAIAQKYSDLIQDKKIQVMKNKFELGEYYIKYYVSSDGALNTTGDGEEIHLLNVREDGSFIQPRTMQHCSHVIHYELGIEGFDYHSLRHTHASDLITNGASPKYVQKRLGHKTIKVTLDIYTHLTPEAEAHDNQIFNQMYG